MIIAGVFLIAISMFILYTRLSLILFGKSATGVIVGYGNCTKGTRGFEAYSYRVKYEYKNKEYFANALESVSVSANNIPNKNLHREVEVYFKPERPEVVTIKEFKGTSICGFAFLILGILGVVTSFIA